MSHFYGTLHGSETLDLSVRGQGIARVGGTAESGVTAILGGSEGRAGIRIYEGEAADGGLEDRVSIRFFRRGIIAQEFELYDGPIEECFFSCIRTNTQEVES